MRAPTPNQLVILEHVDRRDDLSFMRPIDLIMTVTDCYTRGWVVGQYPDLRLTDAGRTALQTARITSHG